MRKILEAKGLGDRVKSRSMEICPGGPSNFCPETSDLNMLGITALLVDTFCLRLSGEDNILIYRPLSLVDSTAPVTGLTSHFGQGDQDLEQKDKKGEIFFLFLILMHEAMPLRGDTGRGVKERVEVNRTSLSLLKAISINFFPHLCLSISCGLEKCKSIIAFLITLPCDPKTSVTPPNQRNLNHLDP